MSSLRSAMFAGYNKFDNAKVRIGSWREELALKELTGVTRLANPKNKAVFNATGHRVLFHTDRSDKQDAGKGTSEVSFVDPATVQETNNSSKHRQPGPRAAESKKAFKTIVQAEDEERASFEADRKKEGDFNTVFRQSFKRYSEEASREARPRSLKPGGPPPSQITPPCLAHDVRDERNTCTAMDSQSEGEVGDYTTGTTVTLWNTGGLAPNVGAGRGAFGRDARFTEPGVHPSFFQEVYPDPAPHHPLLPKGLSDLEASTMMFLKRRVAERGRRKALPTVRGLWQLLWPRTYRDSAGKLGPREFREGMAEFEVPVTECERWAVTTAFDTHGCGQISLDKIIHFFRDGGLSTARRDMVRDAFQRLDPSNTGIVAMDRIREACAFSGVPAVMHGRADEEEVTATFLQHMESHHGRSEGGERAVTFETFQEAFRDIGTSCIEGERRREACTEAADKGYYDDTLFESLVTSVG